MKSESIPTVSRWLLALLLVLAVLSCKDSERSTVDLNRQFMQAALHGDIDAVKSCLAKGVDVNVKDEKQHTALKVSAYAGEFEVVKLLLDNGANVNSKPSDYGSALFLLCIKVILTSLTCFSTMALILTL